MFDDIKVTAQVQYPTSSSTTFYTEAPAHAVGTADLIVTNPDGQSQRVAAAYTYGFRRRVRYERRLGWLYRQRTDTAVEFVIRDNTLVSAVVRVHRRDALYVFDICLASRTAAFR